MNTLEKITKIIEDNEPIKRVDIRERVKKAIAEQKVSQNKLSIALGYSPQSFNKFLNGKRPMPLDKLEELFYLLDL